MAARVLVLGSYPAVHPRHGGQVRLAQIVQAYGAIGLEVRQASFFPGHPFYTARPLGPADVALPLERLRSWRGHPSAAAEDLVSGELAAADPFLLQSLEAFSGPVDLVHLEQPWLLPLVHRLRERGHVGPCKLVYGSQNIEHTLKAAIFEQLGIREGGVLVDAVADLERQCAREAALVAAVTDTDASELRGWTDAPVVLAPNGVAPWRSTAETRAAWRAKLAGDDPFALYIASGHPPNVSGLIDCFGGSFAGLSPIQRLVVAGDVGERLAESRWFLRCEVLNRDRALIAGVLPDEDLSALRDLAHCYVLPVTSGGGSNLKTAEALFSGRHVVATPLALRGFEALQDLPGLHVREPGPGFVAAVSGALESPLPPADEQSRRRRDSLTWQQTLSPLVRAVRELAA